VAQAPINSSNDVAETAEKTGMGTSVPAPVEEQVTTPAQTSSTMTRGAETVREEEERPRKRIEIIVKKAGRSGRRGRHVFISWGERSMLL
jgi:hypothetical protein